MRHLKSSFKKWQGEQSVVWPRKDEQWTCWIGNNIWLLLKIKLEPAGRDGKRYYSVKFKRMAFSQWAIHVDLAVIFKYSGWGRQESWLGGGSGKNMRSETQNGQSVNQKGQLCLTTLFQTSRGLLTAIFTRKVMIKLSCVSLRTIEGHGILTAHKLLMRTNFTNKQSHGGSMGTFSHWPKHSNILLCKSHVFSKCKVSNLISQLISL